jgi:uncharacterized repeat protein (TIGR03803 family)
MTSRPLFRSSRMCHSIAVAIAAFMGMAVPHFAQAATYTEAILFQFNTETYGSYPYGGLIRDSAGNLYGTAFSGGTYGAGVVFEISPTGVYTTLYNFTGGADGDRPYASLIRDSAGNFYGTTQLGGDSQYGTVFKLEPSGVESVLHSFTSAEGNEPLSSLVRDRFGNIYGTTYFGGPADTGGVFKLTPHGECTFLHYFDGGVDGALPYAGLTLDANGNLYGTTYVGGSNNKGVVFEISSSGGETILHNFVGGTDGANPYSPLIRDEQGNLYGTTGRGGSTGNGTIFKVTPAGVETVLHSFATQEGSFLTGGLLRDTAGNLYGTAQKGGAGTGGTVFEFTKAGTLIVLHSFDTREDGQYPWSGLILDSQGNLYGTTSQGSDGGGDGVIFELTP